MRGLLLQLIGRAIGLGAVALIAIGLSGVVAGVFGVAAGKSFVAGDPPRVTYTPARCADFFEYAPHARNCEQAATAFAIAGLVLLASGVDQLALGNNGAGGWLSGGLVSVLAALAFGTRFVRRFARP